MSTIPDSEQRFIAEAREAIQKKHGKTSEQLYLEKEERIMTAIHMEVPDRVPVAVYGGYFPMFYVGVPTSAAFYDLGAYRRAVIKTLIDFDPDLYREAAYNDMAAKELEAFDLKQFMWPGGKLPEGYGQQFLEMEIMKPDEYDLYITDPTDFMLRYYLPRTAGAFAPLGKLPSFGEKVAGCIPQSFYFSPLLTEPDFRELGAILLRAGQAQGDLPFKGWEQLLLNLGFPPFYYPGGWSSGPAFDYLANYLRGMRGVMMDMFRQPDKVITACERILEARIARPVRPDASKPEHFRRIQGGAIHFSSDNYLTKKQFEKFCWPTWKKALLHSIELGWMPGIWCEGKNDDRVEYFLELPKGKFYVRFEQVDMARVKSILGDHCCISGNVPPSLLKSGSVQDVDDYCKNLIKTCGKNGGFIMETASSVEAAKPQNLKAMMDAAHKYGQY